VAGNSLHETVLKNEAISVLNITPGGVIIDVTFGRGGHSKAILKQLGTEGRLIAVDRDPEAIDEAVQLQQQDARLEVAHAPFSQLGELAASKNIQGKVSGCKAS